MAGTERSVSEGVNIFGSANSRYFLVQQDNSISLYRVPALLWKKEIEGLIEVIQLCNRGDVFLRTDKGLFKMSALRDSKPEPLSWEKAMLGYSPKSVIDRIYFNTDGNSMFAELVTKETSLSSNIWTLFKGGEGNQNTARGYELALVGNATRTMRVFPKKIIYNSSQQFHWSVSPEFLYFVMGNNIKNDQIVFEIYQTHSTNIFSQFTMNAKNIDGAFIDDNGRVIVSLMEDGITSLVIRDLDGGNCVVELPKRSLLLHVWKNFVCWLTDTALVINDFEGHTICEANLQPLSELKIKYRFMFNKMNEIDLVTFTENELFLTRVDPANLHIDAKRWQFIANFKKETEAEKKARVLQEKELQERRIKEQEDLSRQLASSLVDNAIRKGVDESKVKLILGEDEKKTPLRLELPSKSSSSSEGGKKSTSDPFSESRNVNDIIKDIKINRDKFSEGKITREEYLLTLELLNQELALSSD